MELDAEMPEYTCMVMYKRRDEAIWQAPYVLAKFKVLPRQGELIYFENYMEARVVIKEKIKVVKRLAIVNMLIHISEECDDAKYKYELWTTEFPMTELNK